MSVNDFVAHIAAYLLIAMVCSAILTAAISLFLNLFVMPFFKEKARRQAEKDGRIVEAKKR